MRGRQCNWILAAFISAFMLMGLLPATVSAAPAGSWTDYAEDSFAGGTGTKEDPYLIATEGQLAKLSKDVAEDEDGLSYEGVYFRLENDMDLSAYVWTPIGTHTWWEGGTESSMRSFCGFLMVTERRYPVCMWMKRQIRGAVQGCLGEL